MVFFTYILHIARECNVVSWIGLSELVSGTRMKSLSSNFVLSPLSQFTHLYKQVLCSRQWREYAKSFCGYYSNAECFREIEFVGSVKCVARPCEVCCVVLCHMIKVKVWFYIAQYPVRRTAQGTIHFTPWQTCSFRHQLGFSWKHSSHAAIAQRLFTHMSTSVYSQALIYTAESTEAS